MSPTVPRLIREYVAKDRSMQAKALWYVAPGRAELRDEVVAAPGPGEVRVRALYGAVSRGTERVVCNGRVPPSEFERMRAPFMDGAFRSRSSTVMRPSGE